MSNRLVRATFSALIAMLSWSTFAACAEAQRSIPPVPVDQLLQGPERREIPWKVRLSEPRLTYQQRYLVQVRATIPAEALAYNGKGRKLHFLMKAQAADGEWMKEDQYNDFDVPPDFGDQKDIEYDSGAYFRPGDYVIALIAYDSISGEVNVARKAIHVPPLKDDPLPELDAHLPAVEFPSAYPQQQVASDAVNSGELFPSAHQASWISIGNRQPILVDIVLNITKRPDPPRLLTYRSRYFNSAPVADNYQFDVGRIVQLGNVLAHLELKSGCVRVSAVDVLRMRSVVDRAQQKSLDWDKFEKTITSVDQNTVDARVLRNPKGPAQFMRAYLDAVSADANACGPVVAHYVIVVSHELPFPSRDQKVSAASAERARFYYLYNVAGNAGSDDMGDLLKSAKPVRMPFTSPRDFRKAFARIVSDFREEK